MKPLLFLLCAARMFGWDSTALDLVVNDAVQQQLIPGAVLIIGHDGAIVHRKAYGFRALTPEREAMTVDTIFDAASLTKVIATTPSLMKLLELGKLRIDERATTYLPEFQGGTSAITIRNLMTHYSGLRPDLDLTPPWTGYETGIEKALQDKPTYLPGAHFAYSDINFILLGEIVHRLSGVTLAEYAASNIFAPLGMTDTMFLPPESLRARIAPTEFPLRGVVHDETARIMGGIAGHAGLFTTADDLAKFAQMMLGASPQIFSPLSIARFTSPQSPTGQPVRGLGWDIDSPFSGNRGDLFPIGSYGHTGFTGTSIWIDPASRSYVILLTNAVHPQRGKSITSLRARVATIAAAAFGYAVPRNAQVQTGLDVLAEEKFARLQGKHVGLITNHTGLSADGKRNVDLMLAAGVTVNALFSPEHGIAGTEDRAGIDDGKDSATGLRVQSLYNGPNHRLTPEMLKGVDTLVFDIQDVGARFYTYSCTMIYAMEEAAKRHLPFYVLDRPNPITGLHVEGPMLDEDLHSFVGCADIPVRHGLTLGELAQMVNGERSLGLDLRVVAMRGWQRGDWFDSTGLAWVNPSPNMRSLNAAILYPGIAMLEADANYSVGRGTDAPFEQIGAPWIDGRQLASFLNARAIPGVRLYATRFRPESSNFQGKWIEGVRFQITDRNTLDSVRLGLEVGYALEKLYPGKMSWNANRWLIGNHAVLAAEQAAVDPKEILQNMQERLAAYLERRRQFLLYPESKY